jgi:hypothetical protein
VAGADTILRSGMRCAGHTEPQSKLPVACPERATDVVPPSSSRHQVSSLVSGRPWRRPCPRSARRSHSAPPRMISSRRAVDHVASGFAKLMTIIVTMIMILIESCARPLPLIRSSRRLRRSSRDGKSRIPDTEREPHHAGTRSPMVSRKRGSIPKNGSRTHGGCPLDRRWSRACALLDAAWKRVGIGRSSFRPYGTA